MLYGRAALKNKNDPLEIKGRTNFICSKKAHTYHSEAPWDLEYMNTLTSNLMSKIKIYMLITFC